VLGDGAQATHPEPEGASLSMNTGPSFGGEVAWRPGPADLNSSRLMAFMKRHHLGSFPELMDRSTRDVAWFTSALLDFLEIEFQVPYTQVLDLSGGPPFPRWCVGGKLNITMNCLDRHLRDTLSAKRAALIWEGESGTSRLLSYEELAREVNRCCRALSILGVRKGDAVGLHMPMTPEIVIALLAIARLGGVIIPLFSGYGVSAIASRLKDAGARALFTADGMHRRGRVVPLKETADLAVSQVPSVEHCIVLRHTAHGAPMTEGRDVWWHDLVPSCSDSFDAEITDAEDVVMIIYTSGTTGQPKGAVHTHCGFPIKAAQDMAFGTDVHAGEVIHWITDMGWMMGPWLVFGATLLGATMFIYDGAPDYPKPDRMWEMAARHCVNVFGLSPSYVRSIMPAGVEAVRKHNLSSLRAFASTGEPWNPDPWWWLFREAGESLRPIINYSGGTEISGGIVMGNPILPLKPTAFSGPCPGMAVSVFDESGHSVRGQVGELVILAPWIGMTRGFWNDRARYLDTYWSRWPNTWVHGDFAAVDDDGQWYILGRSDDTIKVAGKRVGPAEVESILVDHPAVNEAAAIAVPHDLKGNEVVCFCVLTPGCAGNAMLRDELQAKVASELGKPLRPRDILFVNDLPKTRNAKVMRRIVRAAYLGLELGDLSSIGNPEAIESVRGAVRG
jgi:acetyl-CoA synthetase